MTNIIEKPSLVKVFASKASEGKYLPVKFGTNQVVLTDDFESIATEGFEEGFEALTSELQMRDLNSLFKYYGSTIKYLFQHGIPEFSKYETYPAGAVVQYKGSLYISNKEVEPKYITQSVTKTTSGGCGCSATVTESSVQCLDEVPPAEPDWCRLITSCQYDADIAKLRATDEALQQSIDNLKGVEGLGVETGTDGIPKLTISLSDGSKAQIPMTAFGGVERTTDGGYKFISPNGSVTELHFNDSDFELKNNTLSIDPDYTQARDKYADQQAQSALSASKAYADEKVKTAQELQAVKDAQQDLALNTFKTETSNTFTTIREETKTSLSNLDSKLDSNIKRIDTLNSQQDAKLNNQEARISSVEQHVSKADGTNQNITDILNGSSTTKIKIGVDSSGKQIVQGACFATCEDITKIDTRLTALKSKNDSLETEKRQLSSQVSSLTSELADYKQRLGDLETENGKIRAGRLIYNVSWLNSNIEASTSEGLKWQYKSFILSRVDNYEYGKIVKITWDIKVTNKAGDQWLLIPDGSPLEYDKSIAAKAKDQFTTQGSGDARVNGATTYMLYSAQLSSLPYIRQNADYGHVYFNIVVYFEKDPSIGYPIGSVLDFLSAASDVNNKPKLTRKEAFG